MTDPEKADVPAGQVLAPVLAPEPVKESEKADEAIFDRFSRRSKLWTYTRRGRKTK
jgi:hypothetical protein